MKKIEKEYNKRFNNQQMPTGNFDVDGLWDAVSNNLDVVAPITASSAHAVWSAKWIWALAFTGILGTAFAAYFFISKNQVETTSFENIAAKELIIDTKEESKNNHSTIIETKSVAQAESQKNQQNEILQSNTKALETTNNLNVSRLTSKNAEKQNQKTSAETSNRIYNSNESSSQNYNSNQTYKRYSSSDSQDHLKNANNELSYSNTLDKENPTATQELKSQAKSNELSAYNEGVDEPQLRLLPSLFRFILSDKLDNNLPILIESNNDIDLDKPKMLSWQFSLTGGVNNFLFKYRHLESSSFASLKNESDTGQWGYQFGFQTDLVLKKHWVISSGISYQNLNSRFDFVDQKNTQVLVGDEIIKIWVDANTGEILNSLTGEAFVDAIATRTIVHHNRFQQFTIPLDFGFQNTYRGFIYSLRAGVGFHYVSAQSGRTLNLNREIIDFAADSAFTPLRSFHIGFRLSPLVGYQLSNQWALTLQPQWAWNPQIGFDDPNLKLTTQQFNLILGMRYSL